MLNRQSRLVGKRVRPGRKRKTQRRQASSVESLEPRHLLAAQVVINEVMFNAASGQDADEWIELHNAGDEAANLNGYQFTSGVGFTFDAVSLGAGEYLIVAADPAKFQADYPDVAVQVVGGWTGRLSNSSERIELSDASGAPIANARYADSGDWADRRREVDFGVEGWTWSAPHDGEGASLELINSDMPQNLGHNWGPSLQAGGTPGAANTQQQEDIAPAIFDVEHQPIIPSSTDSVTITAHVLDEQSDVTVTLHYRVSELDPGAFIELPMFDDGQDGDETPGDGLFTATIPAQENNAVVEFFVRGVDVGGQVRTSPESTDDQGGQEANMLYQVDDTEYPADFPLFRSIMTVSERREFAQQNRNSNAQRNATFIATSGGNVTSRYNVGVRYRGSGTRFDAIANNRINIPSDREWQGVRRLNINANNPHNQIAGSALYNAAGVLVADAIPVRMLSNNDDLNNGRPYAYVEALDGDWASGHIPNDPQGNVYRGRRPNESPPGGQGAGLTHFGENQAPYVSYLKGTNSSQADYSDVVEMTRVFQQASDETFAEEISQVIDVDQWMRAIAMIDLTGYSENGLLTGDRLGDDYAMYRGIEDPRFLMVPYDLDSMFTFRGALKRSENVPALNRLLNHPDTQARYYSQLFDLVDNALSIDRVRAIVTESLRGMRTERQIDSVVSHFERRYEFVQRLPRALSLTTDQTEGYFVTTEDVTGRLRGDASVATTHHVEVNGVEADWNGNTGVWEIEGVPLDVGMNTLNVQTFNASGEVVEQMSIDYFRRAGGVTIVSGTIGSDTTWTAAEGPYQINGNVTVTEEATLTIEPGTVVWFSGNTRLTVLGTLNAVGTAEDRVWFSRIPNGGFWSGIQFRNSMNDNRIEHAVLSFGQSTNGMIGLESSSLTVESSHFSETQLRRIRTQNSSLVVRNSHFTALSEPGETPLTDNNSEHIWGGGIPDGGEWLLENNYFGHTTGHNDAIDFDSPRLPNPIPIIRNNTFAGGGDDALDMTGDNYIQGNHFQNFAKDEFNVDPGESNTISSSGGTFFVIGNVFENVHHAALIKENAYMHFVHNTVVGAERATLYFDLPGQTSGPGRGANVFGNVFTDTPLLLDFVRAQTDLVFEHSVVPPGNDLDPSNIPGGT